MFRVLDLFAGAGGMSLGFLQTNKYQITVAIEKNPSAQSSYERNHKDTVMLDDIMDITNYDDFQLKYGKFDVVVGGPPCQGFSNANRQKNQIISQNNSLVKKYVEVIENLQPKAFVMENVRMLQSDTHRFYCSHIDSSEIKQLGISMKDERLCLYTGECPIDDIVDDLFSLNIVTDMLLPDGAFNILRILLKNSYNEDKRMETIAKKGKQCIKLIKSIPDRNDGISLHYRQYEQLALSTFEDYINGHLSFDKAEPYMSSYINIQRMLSSAKELHDNNIKFDNIQVNDTGVSVNLQSYSVVDYISKKLDRFYLVKDGILNAAWFGAPQLRERYIAIGIRKDLALMYNIQTELPEAEFKQEEFRTVGDAFKDLESLVPSYVIDEPAINLLNNKFNKSKLTELLRNSDMLFNHVTTESREIALKRFAALKQGQNFHDLDQSLINNTYTRPERTQNSIYLRLDYNKPSGTVLNVRKSMWIHPTIDRAVSIREAARLQTFPDSFVFEGTKDSQYQQIGNAVPPLMAKAVGEKLASMLDACSINYNLEEVLEGFVVY